MGEILLFGLSFGFFSNREFKEFKEYSDCRLYSCVGANFSNPRRCELGSKGKAKVDSSHLSNDN